MTKKLPDCIPALAKTLFVEGEAQRRKWMFAACEQDALALRRIAMTLHRWHELECGVEGGGVERDETTGAVNWYSARSGTRIPYPDRETPALKRLAKIMARYPALQAYVQGDPRGAALYIIRPGDVPEGENVESYYSRGIAVYK